MNSDDDQEIDISILYQQQINILQSRIVELEDRLAEYVCYSCDTEFDYDEQIWKCTKCEVKICDDCHEDMVNCQICGEEFCDSCANYCDDCADYFCQVCPPHKCE